MRPLQSRRATSPLIVVLIVIFEVIVAQQDVVRRHTERDLVTNPLGLDAEEDPDPAAQDLEEPDDEEGALEVGDVVEGRAQLQAPRAAQRQVQGNDAVVEDRWPQNEAAAQAEGLVGRVALVLVVEKRQVPILGHVPVEAVQAIDEARADPGPVERRRGAQVPVQGGQRDDGEGREVLERVGEVLAAPARRGGLGPPRDPPVLDQTLSQPDGRGHGHDEGHEDGAAAIAVRARRGRAVGTEEHAQRHEEVGEDAGVAREHIGQQDVAELAVLGLGDAAHAHALQGRQEAAAPRVGQVLQGRDEDADQHDQVRQRQPVPAQHGGRVAPREDPEDQQREGVDGREDGGEPVGREVVRRVVRRRAARVADERRDIDLDEVEVVEVGSPGPDGYGLRKRISGMSLSGGLVGMAQRFCESSVAWEQAVY